MKMKPMPTPEQVRERELAQKRAWYRRWYENPVNRAVANEQSKTYYHTHVQQVRERQDRYREEHREEIREQQRRYREKHRDEIREQQRRYREKHRDEINRRKREAYQRNKLAAFREICRERGIQK